MVLQGWPTNSYLIWTFQLKTIDLTVLAIFDQLALLPKYSILSSSSVLGNDLMPINKYHRTYILPYRI